MSATSNLNPPHHVDLHVGAQIRIARRLRGLSQEKLADALGLTFQQVQKYERGSNRVSASKMWEICRFLSIPIGALYDGLDTLGLQAGDHETAAHVRMVQLPGGPELAQTFVAMPDDARKSLLSVAKAIHGSVVVRDTAQAA
ncbi:MAG: helix-turn-helix domain-containing protein [Caulobacteraceae bacterium]